MFNDCYCSKRPALDATSTPKSPWLFAPPGALPRAARWEEGSDGSRDIPPLPRASSENIRFYSIHPGRAALIRPHPTHRISAPSRQLALDSRRPFFGQVDLAIPADTSRMDNKPPRRYRPSKLGHEQEFPSQPRGWGRNTNVCWPGAPQAVPGRPMRPGGSRFL